MKKIMVYVFLIIIFFLGSCSDKFSKNWAKTSLANNHSIVIIDKYLELHYTENHSMGFNLFSNIETKFRKPLITVLPILVSILLLIYIFNLNDKSFITLLPFVVILSGAVGNIIDRLQNGFVIDFIYFHINDQFKWPIFNLADILVCFGACFLLFEMFYHHKNSEKITNLAK